MAFAISALQWHAIARKRPQFVSIRGALYTGRESLMETMKHPWEAIVHALGAPVMLWRSPAGGEGDLELAYANPAAVTALRLAPGNSTGARFYAIMPASSVMPLLGALYDAAVGVLRTGEARQLRGVSVRFPDAPLNCLHFNCVPVSSQEVALVGESPYRGYLDNSQDIFGVVSPAGDIVYATPSAATMFGFAPEEVGEAMDTLTIDEPGMRALINAWYYVTSNPDSTRTLEYRRQSRDGIWRDMELIVRDCIDNPDVGGVLFNSRDISRRKADERKIMSLNEDLEAFTYTVSHDLQLPLRLLTEGLERTLADAGSALSERARSDLARADELVGHMAVLIRDLLAFSRTGNTPLARSDIDLSSLANEVIEELVRLGGVAPDAFSIQDGLHCTADATLLRQVLANVLGNAVKFSQHVAHPRIQLTGGVNAAGAFFQVRDNGVGFEPEQACQLFTVFRRMHQDSSIPGTGVGLAIVKRIVERHGGRVWAEGAPGEGATIHVELPGGGAVAGEEEGSGRDGAKINPAG